MANMKIFEEVIKMFQTKPKEELVIYSDIPLYSEIRAFFDSDGLYYFSEKKKKWRKGTSILRSLLTGKAHVEGQIAQNRMPEIAKLFGLEMYEDFNVKWLGGKGTFRFSDYGLAKCLGGLYVIDDYALEKILIGEYILQKEEKNGK